MRWTYTLVVPWEWWMSTSRISHSEMDVLIFLTMIHYSVPDGPGRKMVVDIREGEPSLVLRALLINMVISEASFSLMLQRIRARWTESNNGVVSLLYPILGRNLFEQEGVTFVWWHDTDVAALRLHMCWNGMLMDRHGFSSCILANRWCVSRGT